MNSSESTTKPSQLKKGKFKMNEYEVILIKQIIPYFDREGKKQKPNQCKGENVGMQ